MRSLQLGRPPSGDDQKAFQDWVAQAFSEIENVSNEGIETLFDGFTLSAFTDTRSLNPATATASDVANFLATLVNDIQKRGPNRT